MYSRVIKRVAVLALAVLMGLLSGSLCASRNPSTNNIKVVEVKGPDTCSICLEGYSGFNGKYKTPCNHEFHKDCLDKWVWNGKSQKCPLCNTHLPLIVSAPGLVKRFIVPCLAGVVTTATVELMDRCYALHHGWLVNVGCCSYPLMAVGFFSWRFWNDDISLSVYSGSAWGYLLWILQKKLTIGRNRQW
jgi:hypothetical protein